MSGQYQFVGYIGEKGFSGNEFVAEDELVCFNEDIFEKFASGIFDCVFIGIGYANKLVKNKLYELVKGKIPLANIIHPTAVIFPNAVLGEGILIGAYSIVGRNTVINDNVAIVNAVSGGHDCILGKHTYVASRAAIAGRVSIGEYCFRGLNASVRDEIAIGNNVTLGIGSVSIKDIKDDMVCVGNPARCIRNQ